MTETTGIDQSLADLLAASLTEPEPFDWDTSALADWPNIAPTTPATSFTAEPQAGGA
ncbi:MAG TPA: hypothetical protein VGQ35_13870 [Dongiaceae bacterium]|jgi:hypothetical protein|nr:hypothetical protein [Dongiaceae bacterium]